MRHIVLAIFLCLPAVQAADKVIGGPYVVNVGPKSATVSWVVESSEVKIGTAPGQLAPVAPVLHSEHVTYNNLNPGTTYYYDVLGQKGTFKTPPVGPAAFQFVIYGDTRTRHDFHQKVVDAIVKTKPDFVVHTGDLVQDGSNPAMWPFFFNIEKNLLEQTDFFPALGNHERNNLQYYEFFDVRAPYYSFDWGSSHFVVLNSDVANTAISPEARELFWSEQKRWFEEDLKNSQKADFRFAIFHHPPFTSVKKRQKEENPSLGLLPLIEKYKVAAVFNGHDHAYQHFLKDGVHYIVTGGGGAPLYTLDAPPPGITQKIESTEHFVTVKVEGKTAHIEAIALDGHKIDVIDLKAQ